VAVAAVVKHRLPVQAVQAVVAQVLLTMVITGLMEP